ncbi:MAG: PEP-CTERM sorting domain-containing protein [Planctomycetota bacterium]
MPLSPTARAQRLTGAALLAAAAVSIPAHAQTADLIALTGDTAPDANGSFSTFDAPVLNEAGQVAFSSFLTNTTGFGDDRGIFLGDRVALTQVVREGQTDASGDFSFSELREFLALNDAGQTAFSAFIRGPANGGVGIVRGDGSSLTQLVRAGQDAPDANGFFVNIRSPAFNEAGETAFHGRLFRTAGGGSDDHGIFRGDGTSHTRIAREGEAAPDANGSFSEFDEVVALNDAGQAAFRATLNNTTGGTSDDTGIFRGDGSTLTQIARTGQSAPDANGSFSNFGSGVSLNDAGQAAFVGELTGTTGGGSDNAGIFLGDGSTLTQIIRTGQAAPDANGSFSNFGSPSLNDAGQAAFVGFFTGTAGGFGDDSGLFRSDGSILTQIAREGQAAPDANGFFSEFAGGVALNNAGQAAFLGDLTGTIGGSTDDLGLYLFDDGLGLIQIAREGNSFLGSTITELSFAPGFSIQDEGSGLNDLGQVAYQFTLADGRSGIALYTIPEPASLTLLALGVAALTRRSRDDDASD